jgi:hypothetical protein
VKSLKESPSAMEIDQSPTSSGATRSTPPNKDNDLVIITHKEAPKEETSLLSKAEKIKVMVKDHVLIYSWFL